MRACSLLFESFHWLLRYFLGRRRSIGGYNQGQRFQMPTAMVTFNGRITLPTHVRRQLGLKIGDSVDFVEIEKGRFAITPGSSSTMDLEDCTPDTVQVPSYD
jgi:AbrB family looped-hinge helix DNA binding protein